MPSRHGPTIRCFCALCAAAALAASAHAFASLVVVANADTPPLDADTLQKVYLGKVVEVDGRPVTPVNLAKGNKLRQAFMAQYMTEDDEKFVAYWTVRRYIGKGMPPREFTTVEQQLEFLRATPGAIGYVDDATDLRGGLRPILRKP
jgi:ABC-type phosphate transport system substrate-binding protein